MKDMFKLGVFDILTKLAKAIGSKAIAMEFENISGRMMKKLNPKAISEARLMRRGLKTRKKPTEFLGDVTGISKPKPVPAPVNLPSAGVTKKNPVLQKTMTARAPTSVFRSS